MVEFAIVAVVFFMLLLGIMDFGRMLFQWNAAAEATRWGARVAVVCDHDSNQIRGLMKRMLPELVEFLTRELDFPQGVFLMTGTCLVPDNFTLQTEDVVIIQVGETKIENKVQI